MFDGTSLDDDGLHRVKVVSHKGPIIFVPCHKSHIDYLILSYIMYANNMHCPHIAAGDNLSFWPLGTLFRRGGAFFIRRTFKGAPLYSKVFSGYIYRLLAEGFNIEFFIEGGRSRTGKLILPKLGLLSSLLRAYREGACTDMTFVPVYVGYDRVLEESSYLNEIEGGKKDPETLSQVIKARRFLKRRFGKIYINFHEPISLRALLARSGSSIQHMDEEAFSSFCRNLGFRIINAIDRVSVVTPHALVAGAILNCSEARLSLDHIMSHIDTYSRYLMTQEAVFSDTLRADSVHAVRQALDDYVQNKHIDILTDEKGDGLSGEQYMIHENRRPVLEYYKNNCIKCFVPAAYTSLAILEMDVSEFSVQQITGSYAFLQVLFKNEFAFDVDSDPENIIQENIDAFLRQALLAPHPAKPDTYNLTPDGLTKLRSFSGFLKTYLESYWVALRFLNQDAGETTETEDQLRKTMQMGNRIYRTKEIERKEALSKVSFNNALAFFNGRTVNRSGNPDVMGFYTRELRKYLGCF